MSTAIEGVSGTGLEAQSSQTDAVKSLIRWESPHPLSIAGVTSGPIGKGSVTLHGSAGWRGELGDVGGRPLPGYSDPRRAVQSQSGVSPSHSQAAAPGDQLGRV